MRVVWVICGAVFGLAFAYGPTGLYGALAGALAAFVIAEMVAARERISRLERELADLRKRSEARREEALDSEEWGGAEEYASDPLETSSAHKERHYSAPSTPSTPSTPSEEAVSLSPRAGAEARVEPFPGETITPKESRSSILKTVREYFTGGNTLVRVGVIILFIGVAFLLRYVSEHAHLSIQLRLSGVALGAVVLLILGWRLRAKRPGYALALQGGAIGILYLTVFAALRLFHILGPGPAFTILVLLAAFSAALAILQDSMAFAVLAIGCGFLAPVLASSGQGNHVVLFSYYGVLNLCILAIAWFKTWRPLNVVGFLFTFVIGTAWGVLKYRPDLFATTEPFLIGYFLLYVAIAVLFSLRQRPILRGYVDGTIVFGVPIVAFGLQSAMVSDWPYATAHSAIALGAFYLLIAWLLRRQRRETQSLLVEAFVALGITFLTLAVPLALDGRWSSATWALEGAALVWIGCRQHRRLPRAFGVLLQIASGIIFLFDIDAPYSNVPVFNSACIGGVMIAVASVFAARSLQTIHGELRQYERTFTPVLFFWGLLWWLCTGITEISRQVPVPYGVAAGLVLVSATALLSSEVHRRFEISIARWPGVALLPVMVGFALAGARVVSHPMSEGGWFAWPLAFAAFYVLCRRHEGKESVWAPRPPHLMSALFAVTLLTWEFAWQVDHAVKGAGSWLAIAWMLVPAIVLHVLPKLSARVRWPFGAHEETYIVHVGGALAVYVILWSLVTNVTMSGNAYPFPYLPVLNPLDVAQVFVLLVLARHGLRIKAPQLAWILAALTFVWLNAVLLRTLHHWTGIPYEPEALYRSALVQTALTIFWTVFALATMVFATRRSLRVVWIVGATLIAVVIAKLFLIDLLRIGTFARAVSFVVVGLLVLVVGYFSPLPPSRRQKAT